MCCLQWFTYLLLYLQICGSQANNSSRLAERFLLDDSTITVSVDAHHVIHSLSDKFLSVTLDSSNLYFHLSHFHSSNAKLHNLAKGLAPAYFRFGGTVADQTSFRDKHGHDLVLSEAEYDTLNNFVKSVGWEMVFDLNLRHRKGHEWDPSNAEALMRYTASKGYKVNLELGNEPNLYHGLDFDLDQIGRDYGILKHLMSSIHPFNERLLIGPAVTEGFHDSAGEKFLTHGSTFIDAFTVHHYYMDSKIATKEKFMDPHTLDKFKTALIRVISFVRKHSKGTKTVWIGETSSSWGGGAHGLSESFISGFLWLDKLGLSAAHGVPVVMRQTFVGGHYALVSDNNDPLPDYWISLLFKRLVGKKVLQVTSSEHNNRFRIYAHCSADTHMSPGVTFYFQNMYDSEVKLNIPQYRVHSYHLYILTAGGNGELTSQMAKLNGHNLHMNGDSLPNIQGVQGHTWPVKIPKHSFGFLVAPNGNTPACN